MRQFAEKQHTQINCITFGSLQFSHTSLIWQIPLLPAHANFWSAYFDHCDNVHLHKKIKILEKRIIYIFIVALKFRKPEQNWARIPENPKPPARPLSFRTSKSRNRDVNKMSH